MTDRYEEYCHSGPVFFDSQARDDHVDDLPRNVLPAVPATWSETGAERAFAARGGTLVVIAHRLGSAARADLV